METQKNKCYILMKVISKGNTWSISINQLPTLKEVTKLSLISDNQ